jgi:hypothetical protein
MNLLTALDQDIEIVIRRKPRSRKAARIPRCVRGRMTHCCGQMARQLQHTCEAHSDLRDCPDSLVIHYRTQANSGLRVHDGDSSFITIRHCPWCGTDLLERVSNRELGPPAVKISFFQSWVHGRQFPEAEDADDGNWLRITGHCGASRASVWVQGALLIVTDIERFGLECERLYDGKAERATLEPFEPELRINVEVPTGSDTYALTWKSPPTTWSRRIAYSSRSTRATCRLSSGNAQPWCELTQFAAELARRRRSNLRRARRG